MNKATEAKDILLADDDAEDAEIFRWALDKAKVPHMLRHAKDGNALFVMLKDKRPYILFLDINLPCKDGISCIQELRQSREYDNLPVVVYSGMSMDKNIDDAYRSGANLFMIKGMNINTIVKNLKKVFAINWSEQVYYPAKAQFVLYA